MRQIPVNAPPLAGHPRSRDPRVDASGLPVIRQELKIWDFYECTPRRVSAH